MHAQAWVLPAHVRALCLPRWCGAPRSSRHGAVPAAALREDGGSRAVAAGQDRQRQPPVSVLAWSRRDSAARWGLCAQQLVVGGTALRAWRALLPGPHAGSTAWPTRRPWTSSRRWWRRRQTCRQRTASPSASGACRQCFLGGSLGQRQHPTHRLTGQAGKARRCSRNAAKALLHPGRLARGRWDAAAPCTSALPLTRAFSAAVQPPHT